MEIEYIRVPFPEIEAYIKDNCRVPTYDLASYTLMSTAVVTLT
jgi:hypothetical protein